MSGHRRTAVFALASFILFLLAAIVAAVPGAFGQESRLQITSTATDNWPDVEVTATVLDGSGRPVSGLDAAAFTATSGNTPLPVTGVSSVSDPGIGIAVVMTFDTSGSMAGAPLEQAKTAGKALVQQLGPDDQAAVMSFSNSAIVVQGFTGDHAALDAAIDSLVASGNTALYSGVEASLQLASQAPLPQRAVVLLSDGFDFGGVSTQTRESSLALASQGRAVIFTIGLGDEIDQDYLGQVAAASGGQFRVAPAPGDLQGIYEAAGAILRQQYVLRLDARQVPTNNPSAPLRLEARVGGSVLTTETTLTLPPGVVTGGQATAPPTVVTTAPPLTPAPGEEAGGTSIVLPLAAGGLLLAVLATGGVLLIRRRRRRSPAEEFAAERLAAGGPSRPMEFPGATVEAAAEARAWLQLPDHSRHPLGEEPVTVGFSSDCTVQLPMGPTLALERVRIWRRDANFMLHALSRTGNITVEGKPAVWVVLEDGDEIVLGNARLVFHEPGDAQTES